MKEYRGAWGRLWRDRRGATAVLVAISLPVLLAITGLGVDVGWWYVVKRQNQSAADAAALSAAYEVAAGLTDIADNLTPAATQAATANGWVDDTSPPPGLTPIAVTYPCCAGTYASGGVEVTLQQPQNSWFANFASLAGVTISNRAIAMVQVPPANANACILALEKTGTGIGFTGNYGVSTPNCSIVANSTSKNAIDGVGNGCIAAYALVTAGQYSFTGNSTSPCQSNGYDLASGARFGAAPVTDPYATTLTHAFMTAGMPTAGCSWSPNILGNKTVTLQGNCVSSGQLNINGNNTVNLGGGTVLTGGVDFIGNGTINLSPGTYWITDGSLSVTGNVTLDCPACSPGGAGVTIIFTTTKGSAGTIGTFPSTGNLSVDLNAPGSGTYSGYLFLQDDDVAGATPESGGTVGNTTSADNLDGLIYFPGSKLDFVGNLTPSANCLVAVADAFSFTGNIGLKSTGCPAAGLGTLPTIPTVNLVG